jgi:HlyD family secretion protein
MDVELHLGSMQEVTIPAKLSYIAPEGVMQNGAKMFEVKADATIPDGVTVRSGYSANAEIVLQKVEGVLTIPKAPWCLRVIPPLSCLSMARSIRRRTLSRD